MMLQNSVVKLFKGNGITSTPVVQIGGAVEGKPGGLRGRRSSMPALKIACGLPKKDARRCSFSEDKVEVHEAFTPYGKKYGAAPNDFNLDGEGKMVLVSSEKS